MNTCTLETLFYLHKLHNTFYRFLRGHKRSSFCDALVCVCVCVCVCVSAASDGVHVYGR